MNACSNIYFHVILKSKTIKNANIKKIRPEPLQNCHYSKMQKFNWFLKEFIMKLS
jgi:hypothetical protein